MSLTAVPTLETLPASMLLTEGIASTDLTMTINYVPAVMTQGIVIVDEGLDTEERIAFDGITDNGDDTADLLNLTRGLSYSANDFAAVVANKKDHLANAKVRLVFAHEYFNHIAFIDRANVFETHQTLDTTKELRFLNSGTAIWRTAGGDMTFKDANNAAVTLSTLAAAAGVDTKTRVSANDTTSGYLNGKLLAGTGISFAEGNDGGDETLTISADAATSELTIATGAITVTQGKHTVDTQSDASSDFLDTINGGYDGMLITLRLENSARVVHLTDDGNIDITAKHPGGWLTLFVPDQHIRLIYNGDSSKWELLGETLPERIGQTFEWYTATAPDSMVLCYGQTLALNTYVSAFQTMKNIGGAAPSGTNFTIDSGTDLITSATHGLANGQILQVTNSGGALPAELAVDTAYFVINQTTNTFQLALTQHGAAINFSGNGTGTHSYHTGFVMVDRRGRVALGKDNMGGSSANRATDTEADTLGAAEGADTHTLLKANLPALATSDTYFDLGGAATQRYTATNGAVTANGNKTTLTSADLTSTPVDQMNPYLTTNICCRV